MAKKTGPVSLDDFNSENLLSDEDQILDDELDQDEEIVDEQEDESDEEEAPKKKKKKKTTIIEEEEEEQPKPTKKTAKKKKAAPVIDEEEEEEEEEEIADPDEEEEEDEKDDTDDSDSVNPITFFSEVEKITGVEVAVDYGQTDPLTPQGIALREKALGEKVLDNFLEEVKASHPQLFKAFEYTFAGGSIEDLFQKATQRDYTKLELKDGDEDLARQVLKEYYQSRGVKSDSKLARLVQTDEESEDGLIKSAQAVAKELGESQAAEQSTRLETQKQAKAAQNRKDQAFVQSIAEIVDKGVIDSFKLTGRKEAEEFKSHLMDSIERTADGYAFRIDIDPKNLTKILQSEYFRFKGGDLSKLIQVKAQTAATSKLKLKLEGDKKKPKGSGADSATGAGGFSMKDFNV
jgi:hypothetical protein